jgi:hypothetical protein
MKINLRGALAVIFFLLSAHPVRLYAQSGEMTGLVNSSIDSVVFIMANDASGKVVSKGSGFLVSADGRIVTNHHVIAGASSASVKLNNGSFFPVEGVIADDPEQDLAVLKVPGKGLPFLNLGDSEASAVGQRVLAIGSPLGLENSVSDGIVSALRTDGSGKSWIQTTAPASHGNSGGPLLAMDGKVIGVLTWKKEEGENLNFAAPSNSIKSLLKNSVVEPLGSVPKSTAGATGGRDRSERIWTSLTSGRDFKLRIDGDYIYAEWVNLPPVLQSTAAFIRYELKKDGNKWIGKAISNLPSSYNSSYMDFWRTGQQIGTENVNWCHSQVDIEIDSFSESRIEGQSLSATSFDVKKCKPGKREWKSFTWIPK